MNSTLTKDIIIPDELGVTRLSKIAMRCRCLEDTGLSRELATDLIAKQIFELGTPSLAALAKVLRLPGALIENLLDFMRTEALVEVRPNRSDQPGLRYALTDRGRAAALEALLRSGYIGPAPVPLKQYRRVIRSQTIHNQIISRAAIHSAFRDVVIDEDLLDRLGASLNSGRAIFIYGQPGTGKTYISQRLARLFPDPVLVPYAVAIGNEVLQVFDPMIHEVLDPQIDDDDYALTRGPDRRYQVCKRPVAITGGELTADMLEVTYDTATKLYQAPLQMKANNGVFVIDDLGRQRIAPEQLFNRWIMPLEERRDYLTLRSGRHFSVPFDTVLILSTNIHPLELADEAFLRRIGHKIRFKPMSSEAFERLWRDTCLQFEVDYDHEVLEFVINELHARHNVNLLPCHPRDLISLAIDHAVYTENERVVDIERMRWAWRNYFVSMDNGS